MKARCRVPLYDQNGVEFTEWDMRKPPDLNAARTFVAAAQAGTLSGAARDLEVPTSTVSRSLTRLERQVGLLLVRRSPQGLALTDAGKDYRSEERRVGQEGR